MGATASNVDGADDVNLAESRRTRLDAAHEQPRDQTSNGTPAADSREVTAFDVNNAGAALLEVEEPTAEMVAAVAGENLELRREQLQLQVAQLAAHLRQRLREVDRREAAINARLAQLECDLRTNKLWLSERELGFQERENELQRQIEELQEKSDVKRGDEEQAAQDAKAVAAELAERQQQIELHEDSIRERRFEVDRQAAALRHSQQVWQHEREREEANLAAQRCRFENEAAEWQQQFERQIAERREQLEQELADKRDQSEREIIEDRHRLEAETAAAREQLQAEIAAAKQQLQHEIAIAKQSLEQEIGESRKRFNEACDQRDQQLQAAEAMIHEQGETVERERAAITIERRDWDEQKKRQRQAIDELRQAAEAELTDRRSRLEARQEWIERQKAGLEQVRDEALKLHRQSLEMRLLAEQVWSQITVTRSPAEVTQAVAAARVQMADQYRLEENQLIARRDELVELSEKVAQQHRELVQLRDGVRDWGLARQKEIERQAAALVERELALDAQEEKAKQREQNWISQRHEYERQIREWSARMRSLPQAA